jgi:hypothetical protein
MSDKLINFLKEAQVALLHIAVLKKEGKDKEVIKWHTKLDNALHGYVGEKDKTKEEKEKGV